MTTVIDTRLQHESLTTTAYHEIRRRIVSLEFEPGARLNIDKLAREFGISPTPLREALNRLAAQKLIRVETYKGFSVEPLLDEAQLKNLYALRQVLECYAVEVAAVRIDRKTIAALRQSIAQMERLTGSRSFDALVFSEMDQQFHERIIALADNDLLLDTFRSLNVHMQIARLFQQRAVKHGTAANVEHKAIVDALASGDTQAAVAALLSHVTKGLERLLNLIQQREPTVPDQR